VPDVSDAQDTSRPNSIVTTPRIVSALRASDMRRAASASRNAYHSVADAASGIALSVGRSMRDVRDVTAPQSQPTLFTAGRRHVEREARAGERLIAPDPPRNKRTEAGVNTDARAGAFASMQEYNDVHLRRESQAEHARKIKARAYADSALRDARVREDDAESHRETARVDQEVRQRHLDSFRALAPNGRALSIVESSMPIAIKGAVL
jgi:hypothetical protein